MTLKGTKFCTTYADSYATWTVTSWRGGEAWNCEIVDNEDYGGTKKVFGTEEIKRAVAYDKAVAASMNDTKDWWANRTVGEIVHYHNGFGQYVRGEIVRAGHEMKMRPTALVGNWHARDLPRRRRDGSVEYSYHVKKIRFPDVDSLLQPHESNMVESPRFSRMRSSDDPRTLPVIDLSDPPELIGVEAEHAKLENMRTRAINALQEGHDDPVAAFAMVRKILAETS